MRSAIALQRVATADYGLAIARARSQVERDSLTGREAEVGALHAAYAGGAFRPHLIASSRAWGDDASWQRETWRLTRDGGALADLRGQVLDAAGDFCLLCNASRPREVDHFLPKDEHPALSILHLNLIGACPRCNRHKATSCELDPEMQFLHPYFETIPTDVVFLNCSPFHRGDLTPLFRLAPPAAWPEGLGARLAWQFARLQLDSHYSDKAIPFFRGQSLWWLKTARRGWPALEENLQGALESEVHFNGQNTWKAAFLRNLLDDPDFQAAPLDLLVRNGAAGLDRYL